MSEAGILSQPRGEESMAKGISAIYKYEQGGEFRLKQPPDKTEFQYTGILSFLQYMCSWVSAKFPTESLLIKNI